MISRRAGFYLLLFLFVCGTAALGYLVPRTAFLPALLIFSALFLIYWALYQLTGAQLSLKRILFLALIVRLVLLIAVPPWSEDYIRFVWDGQLLLQGHNPYTLTPGEFMAMAPPASSEFLQQLYSGMNSPDYHSVYTPVNQLALWLAAWLADENLTRAVVVIRLILIVFEMLTLILMYRMLELLRMPPKRILLYGLNPLVIMEVTGNLHFEGMMLTFILAAMLFLLRNATAASGAFLGAAVAVKLNPLMLVPVFLKKLPKSAWGIFIITCTFVISVGLAPLLWGNALEGYLESLGLYASSFEFNASVYYLLREMGYWTHGYNLIGVWGPVLKWLTLLMIAWVAWKTGKGSAVTWIEKLLLVYWFFFMFSTVVHPWYILPAVAISAFTQKRAFLVWSFLIFLSYHAYQKEDYSESFWILGVEYLGVLLALGWDYGKKFRPKVVSLLQRRWT